MCEASGVFFAGAPAPCFFALRVYNAVIGRHLSTAEYTVEFNEATDRLMSCPTLGDLAEAAGVSHGLMRQARLDPSAGSYRRPPDGWERAVAKLARAKAAELVKLAEELEG